MIGRNRYGSRVNESLVIGPGWADGGSYHMIEFAQCLLERRAGGESGVAWVDAKQGEEALNAVLDGYVACAA